jgi:hemerythrin-like domain-containing protein
MEFDLNQQEPIGRKKFIRTGMITVAGSVALNLFPGCRENEDQEEGEGQKVSPPEDLMQEHGVLNRILLIYDHCRTQLINKAGFPLEAIAGAAGVVRNFVEDYHEKQEENYLFPRFRKANQLTDLVNTLLLQHEAGRKLTDQIIQLSGSSSRTDSENQQLTRALTAFNAMYRPHEAREDTVLFPAFRKIVSRNEYDSLGEEFEKNEHRLFGEDGFEMMVNKVAGIEKALGIYELSQFTPE